jgi:hypothetical protein
MVPPRNGSRGGIDPEPEYHHMSEAQNPTVMVTVYGKPKKKKTSDVIAAFPTALCIGVPSAITLVAQNELGFTPAVHPEPPQTLPELVNLLDYVGRTGLAKQYGAIIVDDASHICDRSMMVWNEEAPAGKSGKKDKFYAYQLLNKYLLMLSGLSRHMGVHLAFTFHERMPGTNADGFFCPGGPNVPSRNQVETLPSWCDINVRAMVDSTYPDPWFPGTYFCDPTNPEWVTGDRTGVCWSKTPGNLREILRASAGGYQLSRVAGLEWQDDVAEELAGYILESSDINGSIKKIAEVNPRFSAGAHQIHLRWACQDGIARATLRKRKAKDLFDLAPKEESKKGTGVPAPPPPMR